MPDIVLQPLSPKLSEQALSRYIQTFLDQERMSVHTFMMLEKLRRNKGYRNSGYSLWDYYATERRRRPYIISEQTLKSYSHKLDEVLVYWDHRYLEAASPFARTSGVCITRYKEIAANLEQCPPTLYLFDQDYQWSLVRTDESQNEMEWNCLQIGEIGSRPKTTRKTAAVTTTITMPSGGPGSAASNLVPLLQAVPKITQL
ncbi:MAG: hypothetical protein K0Q90_99 [Paenibacillaceae bacterium]|jgi:hypothetical protein|nr:hypothetical protein [Paenibacillaceae bacterium]